MTLQYFACNYYAEVSVEKEMKVIATAIHCTIAFSAQRLFPLKNIGFDR